MCQLYQTDCISPRTSPPHSSRRPSTLARKVAARTGRAAPVPRPQSPLQITPTSAAASVLQNQQPQSQAHSTGPETTSTNVIGILADAGDNSSHIVGPANVDDSDILESYVSTTPAAGGTRLIRSYSTSDASDRSTRPVLFRTVPKRPVGVASYQCRASEKCALIEKFIEPHADILLDLFFEQTNSCFPILHEGSFRNAYMTNRRNISAALLSNIYASAMIYWNQSPLIRTNRCPDINFVWVQAYEALSSEVFLSPGMSTVISIILNVGGRPSTSIFCNGGMMGLAVAFANALGLNRDPSNWNISPLEKQIRINIWWLVVVQDSWCSLAYGTPLLINRAQHDVPFPTFHGVCANNASPSQTDAATTFISFVTLTQVLGRYLEYVYRAKSSTQETLETPSIEHLELLLGNWEETLSDNVRRTVLRGTKLEGPGAANLRLAYLAVRLLLRRIQLDLDPGTRREGRQSDSPVQLRAKRAAEEVVHFVQELDERHLRGFWHPATGYALTSATSFLLRSALGVRSSNSNAPRSNTVLQIAQEMIDTLRSHRENHGWEIADNCLSNCGEILQNIRAARDYSSPALSSIENLPDIDLSVLDDLISGSGDYLGMEW